MRVIDINDPLAPKEVARWQTRDAGGRILHDIDVRDGLAYLSYWNEGVVVLDVGSGIKAGSPTNPQLVSQHKYDLNALYREVEREGGPGYIRGTHTAWRKGNYVFAGDEVFSATPQGVRMPGLGLGKANGRIHVIDVSDLTNPRAVAWYEPGDGGAHNVWVAGETLYLGDYQGGLRVVDVSGELRGDLLAQGREMAKVHTGDERGFLPNAAMTWGAFYHNGLVWANDMFSGLWAVRLEPRQEKRPTIPSPVRSPLTAPDGDAGRLQGEGKRRDPLQGGEVDGIDRTGIVARRFLAHEGIASVRRKGDAVRDALGGRNPRRLGPAAGVEDAHALGLFVGHQHPATVG